MKFLFINEAFDHSKVSYFGYATFMSFLYILSVLNQLQPVYGTRKIDVDYNYYHKSSDMDEILSKLKDKCLGKIEEVPVFKYFPKLNTSEKEKLKFLKYYDITGRSNINQNPNKNRQKFKFNLKNSKMKAQPNYQKQNAFILGGEHAREMIASEAVFNFVQFLCSPPEEEKTTALELLETFNFRIIVNSNPRGRELVEQGETCKRTNLNNVDINRNWDIFWANETSTAEEFPGVKPFSEIETQFIDRAVKNFKPKLFLTVHSGVYGLFLPYAFREEVGSLNKDNMLTVLNEIKNKYCSVCDVGSPAKLIGYKSSGTCLDYIYDNYKVPYSFAWEIYTNEKVLPELEKEIYGEREVIPVNGPINFQDAIIEPSSFLKTEEKELFVAKSSWMNSFYTSNTRVYTDSEKDLCVKLFNPLSKPAYKFIINNWKNAIIHLLKFIKRN